MTGKSLTVTGKRLTVTGKSLTVTGKFRTMAGKILTMAGKVRIYVHAAVIPLRKGGRPSPPSRTRSLGRDRFCLKQERDPGGR